MAVFCMEAVLAVRGWAVNHPAGSPGCGWLPAPGARVALPLSPCLVGVTAGCAGQGELTLTMGQVQPWQHWVSPPTHSHPYPPRKQQTLCTSSICGAASFPLSLSEISAAPSTSGSSMEIGMVEDI